MNRKTMESANSQCTSAFGVAGTEKSGYRHQSFGRSFVEGDAEVSIIVFPRGRTQLVGMQSGHQPRNLTASSQRCARRKPKLDLNRGSERNALGGHDA
jgi:hypothetical protein